MPSPTSALEEMFHRHVTSVTGTTFHFLSSIQHAGAFLAWPNNLARRARVFIADSSFLRPLSLPNELEGLKRNRRWTWKARKLLQGKLKAKKTTRAASLSFTIHLLIRTSESNKLSVFDESGVCHLVIQMVYEVDKDQNDPRKTRSSPKSRAFKALVQNICSKPLWFALSKDENISIGVWPYVKKLITIINNRSKSMKARVAGRIRAGAVMSRDHLGSQSPSKSTNVEFLRFCWSLPRSVGIVPLFPSRLAHFTYSRSSGSRRGEPLTKPDFTNVSRDGKLSEAQSVNALITANARTMEKLSLSAEIKATESSQEPTSVLLSLRSVFVSNPHEEDLFWDNIPHELENLALGAHPHYSCFSQSSATSTKAFMWSLLSRELISILSRIPTKSLSTLGFSFWESEDDFAIFNLVSNSCPGLEVLEIHQYTPLD
ncbi:hypothetical protein C8J56DRAFT_1054626 [Mycena floridula]|nr:hypothetical protein C8J56DRAFT_1054626 [Mycena floridula]